MRRTTEGSSQVTTVWRGATGRTWGVLLALAVVLAGFSMPAPAAATAEREPISSRGTEFWLAFPANYQPTAPKLFLSGDVATTATVSIPGRPWSTTAAITPGDVTTIALPAASDIQNSDLVEAHGVRVVAEAPITVYGLSQHPATTDAFLAYPVSSLGTEYRILAYQGGMGSQLAVAGAVDGTTVTITPSVTVGTRQAGVPYSVALDAGDTYQLRAAGAGDLTGTLVTSDEVVSVYGSNRCVNIPVGFSACDHIVQQLPPTPTWGTSFAAMPLLRRTGGSTFRVLAAEDGTEVRFNDQVVATLAAGAFHEQIVTSPLQITTSAPALVAQYGHGINFDGTTGDPMMMLIPGTEQYLGSYTITTPASGFATHHLNLVVSQRGVGSVLLDGVAIPADEYVEIGDGMWGLQRDITPGVHNLESDTPFGIFVYGWNSADSYGYPGGTGFSPVASVAEVDFGETIGEQQQATPGEEVCFPVNVRDAQQRPLAGVRVDYAVSGANSLEGYAFTGEDGTAAWCYTGEDPGEDTVTASVSSREVSTIVEWGAVASAPSAPTAVTVAGGHGGVEVSWDAPEQDGGAAISGYLVEYRVADGEWVSLPEPAASPVHVGGLGDGVPVEVRVRAVNVAGAGAHSPVAAGTTFSAPSVPTALMVEPGAGRLVLEWSAPVSDGGSAVSGYLIEHRVDGGPWQVTGEVSETALEIEGLANGVPVEVRVAAVNVVGVGASAAAGGTPRTTADAPSGLELVPGSGEVVVSWTAPEEDGGAAISDFVVEHRVGDGEWVSTAATASPVTIDGLPEGVQVAVRVSARNAAGTGTASAEATVTTFARPSAPAALMVEPGAGRLVLEWSAPVSDGGSAVSGYLVEHRVDGGPWQVTGEVSETALEIEGLANGVPVEVRVAAVNVVGVGASAAAGGTPRTTADAPSGLELVPGSGEVVVSWTAPEEDGGAAISDFVVEHRVGDGEWVSTAATASPVTIDGLPEGVQVAVRVSARNAAGTGTASAEATVTTFARPSAPAALMVEPGAGRLVLEWSAPVSDGGSVVSGYLVEHRVDGGPWQVTGEVSETALEIEGLANGVPVEVRVAAVNVVGVGPWLQRSTPVTPRTVPGAPEGTPTAEPGDRSVRLSWEAPTQDGGAPVLGYEVQVRDGDGTWRTVHTVNEPFALVSGLDNGQPVQLRVVPVNAAGAGAASAVVTAVPRTRASLPRAIRVTPGRGSATVEWDAPASDGGAPITGYRILVEPGGRVIDVPAAPRRAVVDDLPNGVRSTFKVAAVNAAGTTGWSESSASALPLTIYSVEEGVERIRGAERAATAATLASTLFDPGVPVVYLVSRDAFADGLAGGPAAALAGGPILLTDPDELPEATLRELERLQPGRIVIVGGTGVVSQQVEVALASHTAGDVTRIAGGDRYETAAAVSATTFEPGVDVAYVATGRGFADSLAGGPAASLTGGPILLTDPAELPVTVAAELERLTPGRIVVLGGAAAVSEAVVETLGTLTEGRVTRLAGPDRYGTSAAVTAASFGDRIDTIYVATGSAFPDALAATPVVHAHGAALLLVDVDEIPAPVAAELTRLAPQRVIVLGGAGAVSTAVEAQLRGFLRGT
jgi:putative cell wall-binding protein